MVGGNPAVFERARPLLVALGRTITHVGGHGAGQVVKACNQIVQVVNIQGIAEAMLFASRNGVETSKMLQALQAGFAGSKMLDLMGPKMSERRFEAGIEARLHQKDFALVMRDDPGAGTVAAGGGDGVAAAERAGRQRLGTRRHLVAVAGARRR